MMTLVIENFTFETVVGILKEERTKRQSVEVCVNVEYEYANGGFLDYMKICKEIKKEFEIKRFRLLEEAAISVCDSLKSSNSSIVSIDIKIVKPEVRNDAKVGVIFKKNFL